MTSVLLLPIIKVHSKNTYKIHQYDEPWKSFKSLNVSILPLSNVKKKSSKIHVTETSDFFFNSKWRLWILRGIFRKNCAKHGCQPVRKNFYVTVMQKIFQKLLLFYQKESRIFIWTPVSRFFGKEQDILITNDFNC